MCIYLRGLDAAVAEDFLDVADVGTGFQQMCGMAVSQHVGCHGPLDTCPPGGGLFHHLLQAAVAVALAHGFAFKQKGQWLVVVQIGRQSRNQKVPVSG